MENLDAQLKVLFDPIRRDAFGYKTKICNYLRKNEIRREGKAVYSRATMTCSSQAEKRNASIRANHVSLNSIR